LLMGLLFLCQIVLCSDIFVIGVTLTNTGSKVNQTAFLSPCALEICTLQESKSLTLLSGLHIKENSRMIAG